MNREDFLKHESAVLRNLSLLIKESAMTFAKTYTTKEDAIAFLIKEGYHWNESTQRYERGELYLTLARGYVGKCKSGKWVISAA